MRIGKTSISLPAQLVFGFFHDLYGRLRYIFPKRKNCAAVLCDGGGKAACQKDQAMNTRTGQKKKIVVGAAPPKRLSEKAKKTLASARPSQKALKRAASAVKLQVVDGAKVGL